MEMKEPDSTIRHSLDPSDWEEFREIGYRAVDDAVDMTRNLRDQSVWRPLPPASKATIRSKPMEAGLGEQATYNIVREHILPYRFGNIHPRYWSRMGGSGFPLASLADFLSSVMNSNTAGQESCGTETEEAVLEWLKDILKLDAGFSAVLTSGCSTAHIIAMTVCRNQMGGVDVNELGVGAIKQPLIFYCSDQTHNCIDKAMATIGLGISNLRRLPSNSDFQLDIAVLRRQIASDRLAGLKPACIVGNVGTLSTGSIDDLEALADLCQNEGLWFHLDGAFGAFAMLSPELQPMLKGFDRADSVAVDLHKWLQMPYDIGCAFVRDPIAHRKAFTNEAAYLALTPRGPSSSKVRFFELGMDLSRNCKALKVWMGLKAYGLAPFRDVVERNVRQARYVAQRVEFEPTLELMFRPKLNVVCFRALTGGTAAEDDAANAEIALRIQESGLAMLQTIPLNGRTVLRLGIVNHRSMEEDFDVVVNEILRISSDLSAAID